MNANCSAVILKKLPEKLGDPGQFLIPSHTSLTLRKHSDKSSDSETHASCDSSLKTQTKDIPPAVDIQTLPESDVEDPNLLGS
ncbi:hypothetical protein Tco_1542937 [Tanacetum coccineum]